MSEDLALSLRREEDDLMTVCNADTDQLIILFNADGNDAARHDI